MTNNNLKPLFISIDNIQEPYFEPEVFVYIFYENIKCYSYMISNYGRVYSLLRNSYSTITYDDRGYARVALQTIENTNRTVQVHRLVATAFIPRNEYDIINRNIVNHKNAITSYNYYKNLEWCTVKENNNHARDMGLIIPIKGEEVQSSRFTEELVHQVCILLEHNIPTYKCCDMLNIENTYNNRKIISRIKRGISWKHISCGYNIQYEEVVKQDYSNYIIRICELLELGLSYKDIAVKIGLDYDEKIRSLIRQIKNKRYHTNISKNYNF